MTFEHIILSKKKSYIKSAMFCFDSSVLELSASRDHKKNPVTLKRHASDTMLWFIFPATHQREHVNIFHLVVFFSLMVTFWCLLFFELLCPSSGDAGGLCVCVFLGASGRAALVATLNFSCLTVFSRYCKGTFFFWQPTKAKRSFNVSFHLLKCFS